MKGMTPGVGVAVSNSLSSHSLIFFFSIVVSALSPYYEFSYKFQILHFKLSKLNLLIFIVSISLLAVCFPFIPEHIYNNCLKSFPSGSIFFCHF